MLKKEIWPRLAKKGKMICPECGRKTFVPYVREDGEIIDAGVGRCDREHKCGYHYTPSQYYHDNPDTYKPRAYSAPRIVQEPPPTYIDVETFKKSLRAYGQNHFVTFLSGLFGDEATLRLIEAYYIGTSRHWEGSTVFWQIDSRWHIRTGKVMLYNPKDGHRAKGPGNNGKVTFAHAAMGLHGFNLKQCLFGEHLLKKDCDAAVAIFESEKTALLASCALHGGLMLSCGGCGNLQPRTCEALIGRCVVLFPDNGKFDEWKRKGMEVQHLLSGLAISRIMEYRAEALGEDIGDLIVRGQISHENIKDLDLIWLKTPLREQEQGARHECMPVVPDSLREPAETACGGSRYPFEEEPEPLKKLAMAEEALHSNDQVERWRAMLFVGTYTAMVNKCGKTKTEN